MAPPSVSRNVAFSATEPLDAVSTRSLDFIFAALSVLVALTTLALPFVTGYGTSLFQMIAFGGLALLAVVTSTTYADTHRVAGLAVSAVLNVCVFWLVAVPAWRLTRRRRPIIGMVALMFFAALHIALLFWLFPATDGP